ncbi:MAG: hypothetical protein AB1750_11325 [Chloroflexota bacterium]
MMIDYNAITAIAAVLAVVIATTAIIVEGKRSRIRQGIDLIIRLNEFFSYNKDFKRTRRAAGAFLRRIQNQSGQKRGKNKRRKSSIFISEGSVELGEVLDFFQLIAVMVRKNALDEDIAWNFYGYYLEGYLLLSRNYIDFCRQSSPDYWEDVDWMYKLFVKIEKKESTIGYKMLSPEELQSFINDECRLNTD